MMNVHNTVLENPMQKSGDYPIALRDATSVFVEEQQDLVPTYMGGAVMNLLENKVKVLEAGGYETNALMAKHEAVDVIDSVRGNIIVMINTMKQQGYNGYPDLMVLTNDLITKNPAIVKPEWLRVQSNGHPCRSGQHIWPSLRNRSKRSSRFRLQNKHPDNECQTCKFLHCNLV